MIAFSYDWQQVNLIIKTLFKVMLTPSFMIAFGSVKWPDYFKGTLFNTFWIYVIQNLVIRSISGYLEYRSIDSSWKVFLAGTLAALIISAVSGWLVSKLSPKLYGILTGNRTGA